jgi:transcription initiation factor TFIIIB Brf1 subunit/transcription initiation factor TFIIB
MSQTATDDAPQILRRITDAAGFDEAIAGLALQVFEHAVDEGAIEEDVERAGDGTFEGNDTRFPPAVYPAAVYAAARIRDIPTKPGEVARAATAPVEPNPALAAAPDEDDVANYYKRMLSAIPFEVEPEAPDDWVRRLCDDLNVGPAFESEAVDLCDDAVDAGLHIGKATSGFAAAVVYAVSKHRNAGVNQDDIADTASVSPTTVRNQYRDVLALRDGAVEPGDPDAIDAAVNDLCDRIDGLPGRVRADALELAAAASEHDADWVERTDPKGVAAGVVYVTAKDARVDVSQTEVASTANVSKSTVVNRVNDIRDWRKRLKFDGVNYNDLKRLANENDVDVGATPEREYLVDRLADAGVDP